MTYEEFKQMIVDTVTQKQGCKATELMGERAVVQAMLDANSDTITAIEDLVKSGELVEIEYILPTIPYRIKSFLLPRGSSVPHHG